MGSTPKIDAVAFKEIAQLIYSQSGILMAPNKVYLAEARLGPLLQELDVKDYPALCRRARSDNHALNRVIDEVSTNETSWFRDKAPFDLLKFKLIPDLMDRASAHDGTINIWSAASSTGQEVYSIAITLCELLSPGMLQRVRITGTDISTSAVRRASLGEYTDFEVERGLSSAQRDRYFQRHGNGWRVRDNLRSCVHFKQFNLLDSYAAIGRMDIVFCRNVAIYFDLSTRQAIFERIARQMPRDGAMLIGASESLHGVSEAFEKKEHLRCIYYSPKARS